jgi:hypothetical protein
MARWRTIFFAINFGFAVALVALSVEPLMELFAGGGTPGSLGGVVCCGWPAAAIAPAEWLLYFHNVRGLERPLGIVSGIGGLLALTALISNAAEAISTGNSPGVGFWLGFGSICIGAAAYAFWCAWLRIRQRTTPEERGFPVEQSRTP